VRNDVEGHPGIVRRRPVNSSPVPICVEDVRRCRAATTYKQVASRNDENSRKVHQPFGDKISQAVVVAGDVETVLLILEMGTL
jgi:hypothetical protein